MFPWYKARSTETTKEMGRLGEAQTCEIGAFKAFALIVCSVYFTDTDFIRQFGSEVALTNRSLLRDEIVICVYPCYHTAADKEKPLSERDKRMVRKKFIFVSRIKLIVDNLFPTSKPVLIFFVFRQSKPYCRDMVLTPPMKNRGRKRSTCRF